MSLSVLLRPYRASDQEAAIALWHRTWQHAYPDIDFTARLPWWRERWRDELVAKATVVVAERDGALNGFVTIDETGYLDQIVVAPEAQGTECAARLLNEAKRLSPRGVTLKVNADNHRAIAFYRRHGFARTAQETNESNRLIDCMAWEP